MRKHTTIPQKQTPKGPAAARSIMIGIDIGDRWSHYCILDEEGKVFEEGRFRTTPTSVGKHFQGVPAARIAIEAGTHSIWIREQLARYGHEVIVANVTELHAIVRNIRKSDQVDAEKLARYARLDPRILRPITHRSVEAQQELTVVRARDVLSGALLQALTPLLEQIEQLSEQIKQYDRMILEMSQVVTQKHSCSEQCMAWDR